MAATFYILYSGSLDRYYIGHTTELMAERLRKHLSNHRHWTARAKDWVVVYDEAYPDKAAAYRREREVKGWKSRVRMEELASRPQAGWSLVRPATLRGQSPRLVSEAADRPPRSFDGSHLLPFTKPVERRRERYPT